MNELCGSTKCRNVRIVLPAACYWAILPSSLYQKHLPHKNYIIDQYYLPGKEESNPYFTLQSGRLDTQAEH